MRAVKLCQRGVKDPLGRLVMPVSGAEIAIEMSYRLGQRAAPAPYALPAGFAMFLAVGTAAAALHGRLPAGGVLIACAAGCLSPCRSRPSRSRRCCWPASAG